MPPLNKDFLSLLQDDYTRYTCFIETGTMNGDTTFALEPFFQKVYTIEFSELYHNRTKQNYKGNKIQFLLGDSSLVFPTLLPTIQGKAIFFLDGHWSAADTGRSSKDCPLIEEILYIQTLFKHEAILIIDDARLFGLKLDQDWTGIKKDLILRILAPRIMKLYFLDSSSAKDDRLIIHLSAL
jgi:hypothetical protein